jgi:hypothetical protein
MLRGLSQTRPFHFVERVWSGRFDKPEERTDFFQAGANAAYPRACGSGAVLSNRFERQLQLLPRNSSSLPA